MNEVKQENKKPTICLVMIVKNESEVIRRCLDSVAPYINHWVIVDTGSTDGTQDIIKNHMASLNIPGSLYSKEWKDFGTNRTESLKLSAGLCDYRLVIDADDVLEVENPSAFENLTADAYRIPIKLGSITYLRIQMVKSDQRWGYEGVLHEYINYTGGDGYIPNEGELSGVRMIAGVSGDKRELKGKEKYYHDALIFEKELITNKSLSDGLTSRYWFYCAQSYRDAGMFDRAIAAYQKRIELGGWPEEVYISKLNIAKMQASMDKPLEEVERSLMNAWEFRPIRLEAAHDLIRLYLFQERYFLAFAIGNICLRMGPCSDILFVEHDIWKWRFLDDYSVACYHTGNIDEAIRCIETLTASPEFKEISDDERTRIEGNLSTFRKARDLNQKNEDPVQPPVDEVPAQNNI